MTKRDARSFSKSDLVDIINRQERELAELRAQNAELEAKLAKSKKDSSTSSKPPSSDITKPTEEPAHRAKGKKKGKPGAKPGHPRHDRQQFSADEIDCLREYKLPECPDCSRTLLGSRSTPKRLQQIELRKQPIRITEHRAHAGWCPGCKRVHYAEIPASVRRAGLVGPRLTSLIAFLKGSCHATYSGIQELLRDVCGVSLSRGYLAKLVHKTSRALEPVYDELLRELVQQPRLNVDETGHKEGGQKLWTWCFRAELFTLFRICPSRGSKVLTETLGREFSGLLGCDYFSSYRKYMGGAPDVRVQFCLAHLIRDLRFLTTLPDRVTRGYGERILDVVRRLFRTIHRRSQMNPLRFDRAIVRLRKELLERAKRAPKRSEALAIGARFREHGESYVRFLTTPDVDPTNNLAEQALRFVVIDRKITHGTRSPIGRRWAQRIWTVRATCKQQRRSIYQFVLQALRALLSRKPAPSLLPLTT